MDFNKGKEKTVTNLPEFIRYPEVYRILHEKYKCTHEELKYWIIRNYWARKEDWLPFNSPAKLVPYKSDIPLDFRRERISIYDDDPEYILQYLFQIDFVWPIDPTIKFYVKKWVEEFEVIPSMRLVTIQQLGIDRCWRQWDRVDNEIYSYYPSLELGAKNGMLRFYDKEVNDFAYYRTKIGGTTIPNKELWYYTSDGQNMLSDPNTCFLLEDIIHIERTFEMISREDCIKSLGINIEAPNEKD